MGTVTILFGEMGCGKNYWGSTLARDLGVPFMDGDDVLPPEMREKVEAFSVLPRKMIDEFVHKHLFSAVIHATTCGRDLVVAQALYRDDSRRLLRDQLRDFGLDVRFVWVRPSMWQNFRQVLSRKRGIRWALYWLLSKPFFERPTFEVDRLPL